MDVTSHSTISTSAERWSFTETTAQPAWGLTDERANQLTHGFGFLLSLAAAVSMAPRVMAECGVHQWIGCGLYLTTLILVFAASTLSHSFQTARWRNRFRTLDQVSIFLLISGCFTPFALRYLADGWAWILFTSWALAIAGSLVKLYVTRLNNVTVLAYIGLGWLPALAYRPLIDQIPGNAQMLIAASALLYTLGTQFLINDHRARYLHAVWHVMVVAASVCIHCAIEICVFQDAV